LSALGTFHLGKGTTITSDVIPQGQRKPHRGIFRTLNGDGYTPKWHQHDLHCTVCKGLLKPAVKAYEEPLSVSVWEGACSAVKAADILLVLGSRLSVLSAAQLVDMARAAQTQIVFINDAPVSAVVHHHDVFLYGKLEQILPALWLYQS
jgi:NAD-dependent SIR2 family protein deacetylase